MFSGMFDEACTMPIISGMLSYIDAEVHVISGLWINSASGNLPYVKVLACQVVLTEKHVPGLGGDAGRHAQVGAIRLFLVLRSFDGGGAVGIPTSLPIRQDPKTLTEYPFCDCKVQTHRLRQLHGCK